MARNWGNPEIYHESIPWPLLYVLMYGGVWYDPRALAVLKNNL